jgi:hypothetical protein
MLLSGGLPTSSMPRVRVDSAGAARRRDGSLQVEHVAPRRVSATHHTRRPRLASRWHVTCSLGGGHSTANAGKAGVRGGVSKGDVETNARATSTPRGVRRDTASASATDVEEREQEVEVIGGAKAARASADRCEGPLAEHHRTLTLSQRLKRQSPSPTRLCHTTHLHEVHGASQRGVQLRHVRVLHTQPQQPGLVLVEHGRHRVVALLHAAHQLLQLRALLLRRRQPVAQARVALLRVVVGCQYTVCYSTSSWTDGA